jgi:hypothetical protein
MRCGSSVSLTSPSAPVPIARCRNVVMYVMSGRLSLPARARRRRGARCSPSRQGRAAGARRWARRARTRPPARPPMSLSTRSARVPAREPSGVSLSLSLSRARALDPRPQRLCSESRCPLPSLGHVRRPSPLARSPWCRSSESRARGALTIRVRARAPLPPLVPPGGGGRAAPLSRPAGCGMYFYLEAVHCMQQASSRGRS